MSGGQGEQLSFSDRAGQLGQWFAEYAEHHKAKAEQMEALPGSEAWAKVERNLERARYAYTLQDDLADASRHRSADSELVEALEAANRVIDFAAERLWNGRPTNIAQRPASIDADLRIARQALSRAGETK